MQNKIIHIANGASKIYGLKIKNLKQTAEESEEDKNRGSTDSKKRYGCDAEGERELKEERTKTRQQSNLNRT